MCGSTKDAGFDPLTSSGSKGPGYRLAPGSNGPPGALWDGLLRPFDVSSCCRYRRSELTTRSRHLITLYRDVLDSNVVRWSQISPADTLTAPQHHIGLNHLSCRCRRIAAFYQIHGNNQLNPAESARSADSEYITNTSAAIQHAGRLL